MKVDSVGFEHASEVAKSKAMMHDETGKLGKGVIPEENTPEVKPEISEVIESPSSEEMVNQLFIADVKDEMTAIEKNQNLLEEERVAPEELISNATENITTFAQNDISKFQLAIETIQESMKDNPSDANDVKQGVINSIKEQMDLLLE